MCKLAAQKAICIWVDAPLEVVAAGIDTLAVGTHASAQHLPNSVIRLRCSVLEIITRMLGYRSKRDDLPKEGSFVAEEIL